MTDAHRYPGGELELFAEATTWKRYWSAIVASWLPAGDVLEVGAGIGANTLLLAQPGRHRWTALEPDPVLAGRFRQAVADAALGNTCRVVVGTIRELDPTLRFDAALYIDVLEHIENDAAELREAAARLRPGGRLIVLAPAHAALYSAFDAAIGHHRRYSRRTLVAAAPGSLSLETVRYLDAAGMLASFVNRVALRQSLPTPGQLRFWDRRLVPLSRGLDRWLRHRAGKSLLAVWRRQG